MTAGWTTVPVLAGRHVRLRALERDDAAALAAVVADGDQTRLFFTHAPQLADPQGYIDRLLADQAVGRSLPFAVEDRAGRVVGTTRFLRMSAVNRRLEIGGTLYARSVQRTGVNTETKLLLLRHAFEALGCLCVQIRTDWLNKRSQTAIERLGAKRDGVLRNHVVLPDGRVRDTVVYSILANEWPGVRQNLAYLLARHEEPTP